MTNVTFKTQCVGAPCSLNGMVSSDHKTLTLASENEYRKYDLYSPTGTLLGLKLYAICNYGRVLIRVSDQDDD